VRQVVRDDVRLNAVAVDQPHPLRAVHAIFSDNDGTYLLRTTNA
jgi:hypothetical protein